MRLNDQKEGFFLKKIKVEIKELPNGQYLLFETCNL